MLVACSAVTASTKADLLSGQGDSNTTGFWLFGNAVTMSAR
jgi:hypothetical protein